MTTHTTVASLLSSPHRWCKGTFCRDAAGTPSKLGSSLAVAFCVEGAAVRVYPDTHVRLGMLAKLEAVLGTHLLAHWNDHSTHATVLAAVTKAGI
jgi:hypothetical protein